MAALVQLVPLLFVVFCFFGRCSPRRFFLLAAIVTLPFRTTYGLAQSHHIGWVDGFDISISDIFFLCFWVHTFIGGTFQWNGRSKIAGALTLFALAILPSMFNTTSHTMTGEQFVLILQILALNYLCMAACINSREDLETALMGISLCLIIQGAIGCVQFFLQNNFLLFSTGHSAGETIEVGDPDGASSFIRVFGTVGKPNGYAMILAPLLLISIALLPLKHSRGRFLRILSVVLGSLGLIYSASRGGWLSVAAALLVYGVIFIQQYKGRRLLLLAGAFLFFILAFAISGSVITERLDANDHNAANSRLPLMRVAAEMIKAHPLVGVGGNTYMDVMKQYVPSDYGNLYLYEVHNGYLLVFAEMGLIGFVALLLLLRSLYREGRGAMQCADEALLAALGLGFILVLVQVSVHMLVEMYFVKMTLCMLFTLAGILTAAKNPCMIFGIS